AVVAADRLAAVVQADEAQPPRGQPQPQPTQRPRVVGPAVDQRPGHRFQGALGRPAGARQVDQPGDPAHAPSSIGVVKPDCRPPSVSSRKASASAAGTHSGAWVSWKCSRPLNWLTSSVRPTGGQLGTNDRTSSIRAPQSSGPRPP